MTVRQIKSEDFTSWESLWQGYLTFYEVNLSDDVTQDVWSRLLDPGAPLHGFVYEQAGTVIGFTHFFKHGTTWHPVGYCYLEDLFISKQQRNSGAGRALIHAVQKWAEDHGCARLYWHTNAENKTAQALYNKVAKNNGFIRYDIALGPGKAVTEADTSHRHQPSPVVYG